MATGFQNITLRLPTELLKRVKRLAVERETSVSALLVEALANTDAGERAYEAARRRALVDLRHPRDLGTQGRITWTRDELHER
ncbi:MAG TPA: hypothetical protein VIC54_05665 [Terriglobales bacterium]|jgi:predicted transcriptional regulator